MIKQTNAELNTELVSQRVTLGRLHIERRLLVRALVVLALLTLVAVAVWYWWQPIQDILALLSDQETVSNGLRSYGAWGPLVLAVAQMSQVLIAFIPGHVFLIAAGYVYGFPLGLLMNLTFTVVASQLCFLLAQRAGRPLVVRFVDPKTVDYWERVANEKGILFFTVSFILPVFPSDAMNFIAGLSGITARRFLVANIIGRLPHAIILTLIGSHGLELSRQAWTIIAILAVLFFVVGHLIVGRIRRSALTEVAAPSA